MYGATRSTGTHRLAATRSAADNLKLKYLYEERTPPMRHTVRTHLQLWEMPMSMPQKGTKASRTPRNCHRQYCSGITNIPNLGTDLFFSPFPFLQFPIQLNLHPGFRNPCTAHNKRITLRITFEFLCFSVFRFISGKQRLAIEASAPQWQDVAHSTTIWIVVL